MFRYLERLQKAPVTARRQAAIAATVIMFGIFVLLWLALSFVRGALFGDASAKSAGGGDAAPPAPHGIASPY